MNTADERDQQAEEMVRRAYALEDQAQAVTLYREWASSYDRSMVDGLGYASPRRCARLLVAHIGDRNARILDVGCGTGLAAAELAAQGCHRLHGIDLSPQMLEAAARRAVYQRLIEVDLTGPLPFADGAYGAAICTGTFTHAHVPAACLDELFRILVPGGLFAFTVHRDVWEPMGFCAKLQSLEDEGVIGFVEQFEASFFDTVSEPEGRYCLYRRRE